MTLPLDAEQTNQNLRQRITRGELFSLALAFGAAGAFLWLSPIISYTFFDFKIYLNTAHGIFTGYYYGYWLLPIFALLAKLPLGWSYLLWCTLNIVGVFFAAPALRGGTTPVLFLYQKVFHLLFGG